jgi:hypothetical protein
MSRFAQGFLLASVLAATGLGIAVLYRLRLSQGDVFQAYSSLRADPLGTRAFHDALARLPGLRVERRFTPLERLTAGPPRTIIIAGLESGQWHSITTGDFDALDSAVRGGSRLLLALEADFKEERRDSEGAKVPKAKPADKADKKPDDEPGHHPWPHGAQADPAEKAPPVADLKRLWGVSLSKRIELDHDKGAVLDADAPRELPPSLRWKSGSFFGAEAGSAWRVIYRDLGKPVLMEMPYGRGSIVVASDAYFLSNEALQNDRATRLLTWIVGPNSRVDFDESHLGVLENVGVAALARRYGMEEAFVTLLIVAILFVWQRMALFVPAPREAPDAVFSTSQTAAIEALLLRSVPPSELIAVCEAEWRRSARPSELSRLKAMPAPGQGVPIPDAYNAFARGLRRR